MSKHVLSVDGSGNVQLRDVDREVVDPARKLVSDARSILTPTGIFSTISEPNSNTPIFPVVGAQYRPNNRDFKCPEEGACPNQYTCIKRGDEGRCYELHWNRDH